MHRCTAPCTIGNSLDYLGGHSDASKAFQAALRADPGHVDAHINLGAALFCLEKHEEALGCFDEALRLDASRTGEVECNRGDVLRYMDEEGNEGERALGAYDRSIAASEAADRADGTDGADGTGGGCVGVHSRHCVSAMNKKGRLLVSLGREEEATNIFRDILLIDATHGSATHMLTALGGAGGGVGGKQGEEGGGVSTSGDGGEESAEQEAWRLM